MLSICQTLTNVYQLIGVVEVDDDGIGPVSQIEIS